MCWACGVSSLCEMIKHRFVLLLATLGLLFVTVPIV